MKKLVAILSILFFIVGCSTAFAASTNNVAAVDANTEATLVEITDKQVKSLEDYKELYGSDTYGFTAYILNIVRIYSIPVSFIAIAMGAIFQYVIGIRKLDVRDKGFGLIIASVTLLVICQILPLVFAIVVKGWRG